MKLQVLVVLLMAIAYGVALDCYVCGDKDCGTIDPKKTDKAPCEQNTACLKTVIVFPNQTLTYRNCQLLDSLQRNLLSSINPLQRVLQTSPDPVLRSLVVTPDFRPATEAHHYVCYKDLCNKATREQLSYFSLLFFTVVSIVISNH